MTLRTPVIIGVGEIKNKSLKVEDAQEPMQLMLQAATLALEDTSLPTAAAKKLQSGIDSIDCVATWTWPYSDLPGLLGEKLGANPTHKFCSDHGGNQPAKLLDEAAQRIAKGQAQIALLAGGEALASVSACSAAGRMPPPGWTEPREGADTLISPSLARMAKSESLGTIHSVGLPIHVYPMYENGLRASLQQSLKDNHRESAQLYGQFASVAAQNPISWNHGQSAATEHTIGTITKKNRMICFPYPLLMNAFNTVNLAAACIVTSVEYAKELGVPQDRWIYPLGGAGTRESDDFWERTSYSQSPAISRSLDAALQESSLTASQIDLFDFYSCFPIVPKLACRHLGLSTTKSEKPITLLGGLTSFGGAGNNYSMHAIAELVRQLRDRQDATNGLILANGGCLTYQHAICLSSVPRRGSTPYPITSSLHEVVDDVPSPPIEIHATGEATIETYTVEYSREGKPTQGHIVGRVKSNGRRFVANHADQKTLEQLSSNLQEPIGRSGWVTNDSGTNQNLFSFERTSRL